jgi:hypothetical protein
MQVGETVCCDAAVGRPGLEERIAGRRLIDVGEDVVVAEDVDCTVGIAQSC